MNNAWKTTMKAACLPFYSNWLDSHPIRGVAYTKIRSAAFRSSFLSLHYWMKPNLGDLTSFMNCLVFLGVASASLNPKKKEELAQVATCDVLTVLTH